MSSPRRPSIISRCRYFSAGFISATLTMTFIYLSISESYSNMRPAIASYQSLFSRKTFTPYKRNNFGHLQPLRKMFTNVIKYQRDLHEKLNRTGCMPVALADFSDLEELEQKENVLLLIVVSTAPSRMDRRTAIRETWWSTCQQEKVGYSADYRSRNCK